MSHKKSAMRRTWRELRPTIGFLFWFATGYIWGAYHVIEIPETPLLYIYIGLAVLYLLEPLVEIAFVIQVLFSRLRQRLTRPK